MRPLILTNVAGEKTRVSPLAILGWKAAEIEVAAGRFCLGCMVALADGPRMVLESEAQIDWLFEQATSGAILPPSPEQVAAVLAAWRQAAAADLDDEAT